MNQRLRTVGPHVCIKALQIAVFALGAVVCSWAQALTLGHARVVSAPGAPLQVVVPLLLASPEEAANLRVLLADEASWQRAGLRPPTPLANTVLHLQDGPTPTHRTLRIESSAAPATSVVDLLLDVVSSSGQRQIQVSILTTPRDQASPVTASVGETPGRQSGTENTVPVRNGDTLSGIAQRNAVADASLYQMLVALWRANPHAFIQNNMNLLRAGENLSLPDAATVQAIDPAEARRIFSDQTEAYTRYRSRVAAATAAGPALNRTEATAGKVAASGQLTETPAASGQDRLRVSKGQPTGPEDKVAQADARASTERAMADAQERMNELENNVRVLNKVARQSEQAAPKPERSTIASNDQPEHNAQESGPSTMANPDEAALGSNTGAATSAAAIDERGDSTFDEESLASLHAPQKEALPESSDHLPVIVITVIALAAFIIAWLLRRAGMRRHQRNDTYGDPVNPVLNARLNERLDDIDLHLDESSVDESRYPRGGPKV